MPRDKNALEKLEGQKYKDMDQYINEDDQIKGMSHYISNNTTTNYQNIKKIKSGEEHIVHHANASKKADDGEYVFEFRVAGSGSNQWTKMYKGLTGYNEKADINIDEAEEIKEDQTYFDEIKNHINEKYKINVDKEYSEEELNDAILTEYGKPLYLKDNGDLSEVPSDDSRIMSGIRVRGLNSNKKIVNLSGPLGWFFKNGMSNTGDYSTSSLQNYMLTLARKFLTEASNNPDNTKPIHFYMQGHSRGGVATAEAANMIQYLIHTEFPDLENRVHIHATLYDPVPGMGSYNNHKMVDNRKESMNLYNGKGMGILSESVKERNEEIVMYSMHSNNEVGFAPLNVYGASKVILTGMNHNMGLYDISGNQEEGLHKRGYISSENGEEYRGTGLYDLKDGLYVIDENNIIIELKNHQEAKRMIDEIYSNKANKDWKQSARHKTMYNVVSDYFKYHKEVITKMDTRYASKKKIEDSINELKDIYSSNLKNDKEAFSKRKNELFATIFVNSKLLIDISLDKNRMTDQALIKYQVKANDMTLTSKLLNDTKFVSYMKNMSDEGLGKFLEGNVQKNLEGEYLAFLKTVLPEKIAGINIIENSIKDDVKSLNNILESEKSDNPLNKIPSVNSVKRNVVASILLTKMLDNKCRKESKYKEPKYKENYEKLVSKIQSEVYNAINTPDFINFYSDLDAKDIERISKGEPDVLNGYIAKFEAYRKLTLLDRKMSDIGRIFKSNEEAFKANLFFQDYTNENSDFGEVLPVRKEMSVGPKELINLSICAMLRDGYSIDDILNPCLFENEKQKYGKEVLDNYKDLDKNFVEYASDLYKMGLIAGTQYTKEKLSEMKEVTLDEILNTNSGNLNMVNTFLSNIGSDISKISEKDRNGDFIEKDVEFLLNRQIGINASLGGIFNSAKELYDISSKKENINKDDVETFRKNTIKLRSLEKIYSNALRASKENGSNILDDIKYNSNSFLENANISSMIVDYNIKDNMNSIIDTEIKASKKTPDIIKSMCKRVLSNKETLNKISIENPNSENSTFTREMTKLIKLGNVKESKNLTSFIKATNDSKTIEQNKAKEKDEHLEAISI